MWFPVAGRIQHRLRPEAGDTRLKFTHGAIGEIPDDVLENVGTGWEDVINRIPENAQRKHADRSR
jgi:hypothetical protein